MSENCQQISYSYSKAIQKPSDITSIVLQERDAILGKYPFLNAYFSVVEFEVFQSFKHVGDVTVWFAIKSMGQRNGISFSAHVVSAEISKDSPDFEKSALAKYVFSRF